jgi:hypothetical protein
MLDKLLSILLASLIVAGCSGGASGAGGSSEGALAQAPSRCDANAGTDLANAVGLAARHQQLDGVCKDARLEAIVASATKAVAACPALTDSVRKSASAEPLRAALAGTLSLGFLSGELQIKDASGRIRWDGLAGVLSNGVEVWGAPNDAQVNSDRLRFGANGFVAWSEAVFDDGDAQQWIWGTDAPGTWRVGVIEGDGIHVLVTVKGKQSDFVLSRDENEAGGFAMKRADGLKLLALLKECET